MSGAADRPIVGAPEGVSSGAEWLIGAAAEPATDAAGPAVRAAGADERLVGGTGSSSDGVRTAGISGRVIAVGELCRKLFSRIAAEPDALSER